VERKIYIRKKLQKIEEQLKLREDFYRMLHGDFPVLKLNQKAYIPISWLNEYWQTFYDLNEELFTERKKLMEELNLSTKIIPFPTNKIS